MKGRKKSIVGTPASAAQPSVEQEGGGHGYLGALALMDDSDDEEEEEEEEDLKAMMISQAAYDAYLAPHTALRTATHCMHHPLLHLPGGADLDRKRCAHLTRLCRRCAHHQPNSRPFFLRLSTLRLNST